MKEAHKKLSVGPYTPLRGIRLPNRDHMRWSSSPSTLPWTWPAANFGESSVPQEARGVVAESNTNRFWGYKRELALVCCLAEPTPKAEGDAMLSWGVLEDRQLSFPKDNYYFRE